MSLEDPTVDWEPRVVIYDAEGKPMRRQAGFAPPRERRGQYATEGGGRQREKEAATVRRDSMPRKSGKRGC